MAEKIRLLEEQVNQAKQEKTNHDRKEKNHAEDAKDKNENNIQTEDGMREGSPSEKQGVAAEGEAVPPSRPSQGVFDWLNNNIGGMFAGGANVDSKQPTPTTQRLKVENLGLQEEKEKIAAEKNSLEEQIIALQQQLKQNDPAKKPGEAAFPPAINNNKYGFGLYAAIAESAAERAMVPSQQTTSSSDNQRDQQRNAYLKVGTKVSYISVSHDGYLQATIQGWSETEGMYNLDVRAAAPFDRICPPLEKKQD